MSISDELDPYIFLSKDGKEAVYERRKGHRGVNFAPEHCSFTDDIIKVFFPICTFSWRVNKYVSR